MKAPLRVGIVGCGKISDQYFKGCRAYRVLDVTACADLDLPRARTKAAEHGVPRACSVDELLGAEDIDIVVNLTIPLAHAEVNERALLAGKHVYVEKPFALSAADGKRQLALARKQRRLLGSAPDTFLGGGLQTARKLLDDGVIGTPVAAMAFMVCRGHESWHPSPQFYYQPGGGPLWDMGPYYLTALVNLLGPIARVSGFAGRSFPERTITSQPLAGTRIPVDVSTHYSSTLEFANGVAATVVMSFDVWPGPELPRIVLYGTEGTLDIPDPNTFAGEVRLFRPRVKEPAIMPATHSLERGRGTGVADLACAALRKGRPFRASGALAYHVVEAMECLDRAAAGRRVTLKSTCDRPAPLPVGLGSGELDA
jgi:predicted dehydrogenase